MNTKGSVLQESDFEPRGVSLTSADVQQQKFLIKFRGYDTQDVDAFHDVVAREMERQSNENSRLYDELLLLQREIDMYRKKEDSINAALMTVQKMVDGMKERAAAESDRMLADARIEAERMAGETRNFIALQQEELAALKARADAECSARVAGAREEADRIVADAHQRASVHYNEAAAAKDKSVQQAIKVMDDAQAEAARILSQGQKRIDEAYERMNKFKEQSQAEARRLIEDARGETNRMAAEAQKKANELYGQAQKLQDAAQKEARTLLDAARAEITGMRNDLEKERVHAMDELNALRQRKIQFREGLKALLDTHLRLIEQDDE